MPDSNIPQWNDTEEITPKWDDTEDFPQVEQRIEATPKDQSLSQAMFVANRSNPDKAAQAFKLAKNMSLPSEATDYVERNYDELKVRSKDQSDFDSMLSRFPKTSQFLSDPLNAKVSHDDVEHLTDNERAINFFAARDEALGQIRDTAENIFNTMASGTMSLGAGIARAPFYAIDALEALRATSTKDTPNYIGKEHLNNSVATFFDKQQQAFAEKMPQLSGTLGELYKQKNYQEMPAAIALSVLQSAPQSVATMAVWASGGFIPGMFAAGLPTAADSYKQSLENPETKASTEMQLLAATGKGTVEGLFESIGIDQTVGMLSKEIYKQFGSKFGRQLLVDSFGMVLKSMGIEGAEEAATSGAQDIIDWGTGVNPNALEGSIGRMVESGIIGGFSALSMPQVFMEGRHRALELKQAEQARDFVLSMTEKGKESKLKERLPEKYQEILSKHFEGTSIENVSIDLETFKTYAQSINKSPNEVALELGIAENLNQAEELGTSIQMKTADWAEQAVSKPEHFQGLTNDVNYGDKLSVNQAKKQTESLQADVEQAKKDAQLRKESDSKIIKESKVISENLSKQLQEAGRSKKEADTVAALPESFLRAYVGDRAELSPQEVFDKFKLSVRQGTSEVDLIKQDVSKDQSFSDEEIKILEQSGINLPKIPGTNVVDASALFSNKKQQTVTPESVASTEDVESIGKLLTKGELRNYEKRIDEISSLLDDPTLTDQENDNLSNEIENISSILEKSKRLAVAEEEKAKKGQAPQPFDELVISDHGKKMLQAFRDTFSLINGEKLAYEAQKTNAGPYVADKRNNQSGWVPNYMAEPTGTIGEPRIQEPFDKKGKNTPDPLMWSDSKYEAAKELIQKHIDNNIPLVINTSSDLIAREDYLKLLPADTKVFVYALTNSERANRELFPGMPSRLRQEDAVQKIKEAGIKVKLIEPTKESIIKAIEARGTSIKEFAKKQGFNDVDYMLQAKGVVFRPELKILNQSLPGFYSKLQQTIEQKLPNTVSIEQLKATIKDVKSDELKWSGIEEFLKGKEKVDKAELLDYLRANELKIEEVQRSDENQKTVEIGAIVYGVFDENGESQGTYSTKDAAEEEVSRLEGEDPEQQYSIDKTEWDGEITLEDIDTGSTPRTKFSQYKVPGDSENYREVLLTLPERSAVDNVKIQQNESGEWDVVENGRVLFTGTEESEAEDYKQELDTVRNKDLKTNKKNYRSSHWEQENVLAHTRIDDRVDSNGNKLLFVNEIQSDWHQEGRKKGYQGEQKVFESLPKPNQELALKYKENWDERQLLVRKQDLTESDHSKIKRLEQENTKIAEEYTNIFRGRGVIDHVKIGNVFDENSKAVPQAPFSKNWHEFVFKRLIREAVERGNDRLAWSTGQQQADIYDLSKSVDQIEAYKNKDGTFNIEATRGNNFLLEKRNVKPEALVDIVGKDLADKIISESGEQEGSGFRNYKVDDLKVGGEGMKGFYDKILVDFAKKFGKKYGAKVEDITLIRHTNKRSFDTASLKMTGVIQDKESGRFQVKLEDGSYWGSFESEKQAIQRYNEEFKPEGDQVHSIELTPALKEAALGQGFELFQKEGETKRGEIRIGKHSMDITLLEKADATTFPHEFAHWSLEVMGAINAGEISDATKLPQEVKDDYAQILSFLGVSSREEIQTEQHEKFASAFEAYISEGKAPSERLRSVFHRLKNWFKSIYNFVVGNEAINGIKVSPEMRQVFDRMLATDREIDKIMPTPLFADPARMGMSQELATKYLNAQQEAQAFAEDLLRSKLAKEQKKTQSKEYNELKIATEKGWTKTANEMPIYRLLSVLQNGVNADGTSLSPELEGTKIDEAGLADRYGNEILKSIPKDTITQNGIAPEILAEVFGFKSATQMLDQLSYAIPKQELIDNKTVETLEQFFPDPMKTTLPDDALKALYGEKLAEMRQIELEHMASNNLGTFKKVIEKIAGPPPKKEYIKQQAQDLLNRTPMKDLKPGTYLSNARRARKEAASMLAKGDIKAAFNSQMKEQINSYLYELARNAQEVKDQLNDLIKKHKGKDADIVKSRDTNIVNAGRQILANYNLISNIDVKADYLAVIKQYDSDAYQYLSELVAESQVRGKNNIEDLTFDEFLGLSNTLGALWSMARKERLVEIEGQKLERASVIMELTQRAQEITKDKSYVDRFKEKSGFGKLVENILELKNQMIRIENWSDFMDGTFGGPFRRYIWNPINKASIEYRLKKTESFQKLKDIYSKYDHLFKKQKEAHVTEIRPDLTLTPTQLMMAILHSGNHSNMDKLLRGREWAQLDKNTGLADFTQWNAFLQRAMKDGTITQDHLKMAQEVWDLLGSFKEGTQKAHKEIYGFYFDEITANPIKTPWGEFKGGYIPAVADPTIDSKADQRKTQNELEEQSYAKAFPSTGRGATMKRVQSYAAPLSLELGILSNHIDWALRFTHLQPAVKTVSKIILNSSMREALDNYDNKIVNAAIVPWLQRVATQRVMEAGKSKLVDKVAGYLRRSASMQIMSLNFSNGLQQVTGLFVGLKEVGPYHALNASRQLLFNPLNTNKQMHELSNFMKSWTDNNSFEIQEGIKELSRNDSLWNKADNSQKLIKKHLGIFARVFQGAVNTTLWNASFNKALSEKNTLQKSVEIADSVIRKTQGTGLVESISAFETGSPGELLFKQFISYFNMLANYQIFEGKRIIRDVPGAAKYGHLFYLYAISFMVPSVLANIISKGLRGGFDDDEDYLDYFLKDFLLPQAQTGFAALPYFGPAFNSIINSFNNKPFDDRLSMAPGVQLLETTLNVPGLVFRKAANGKDFTDQDYKKMADALGLVTGLPTGPVFKRGLYIDKALNDDLKVEATPGEIIMGVLTGKERKK